MSKKLRQKAVPYFQVAERDGVTWSIDKLVLDVVPTANFSSSEDAICEAINELFRTMYPAPEHEAPAWWHKAAGSSSWYRHRWARNTGHDDHVDVKLCKKSRGKLDVSLAELEPDDDVAPPSVSVPLADNTIRIEFNPNKLAAYNMAALIAIEKFCDTQHALSYVRRLDLAADVPGTKPDDFIIATKKRKGKYETTRYFGKSMHDGYLKIYDKQVEAGTAAAVSRVEITLCEAGAAPFSADTLRYVTHGPEPLPDVGTLSPTLRKFVDAYQRIAILDAESAREWLETLDARTQKKLEPYTHGTGVRLIDEAAAASALTDLMRIYCVLFHCTAEIGGVKCAF